MSVKVGMISLGCSKNQVDAERMLHLLAEEGFEISGDERECDVIIVNTCGFIEDAKRESIENILGAAQYKSDKLKVLAVTGCLAERYQGQMQTEFPEADVLLGIGSIGEIAGSIKAALAGEKVCRFADKYQLPLDGGRVLSTPQYYAYLKVADGCDNRCGYCAIPDIRGNFRSRPMEEVIAEAQRLAEQGVVELNVVAQDTTRYGEDLYGKLMLPVLLTELCKIDKLHWIRLLYCYPDRVTDELIDLIAREPKIVKYIDLPLQHIHDDTLKRMNRRGESAFIRQLLDKIRSNIPNVYIRTTFIAGLPGETEEEFEALCDFVREQAFERLGCFAYSTEEGTPAGERADQLDEEVRRHRADLVMDLQMGIAAEIAKTLAGQTLEVLCEGFDHEADCYVGRSAMDAPDIDTKVFFTSREKVRPGAFVQVLITGSDSYDIVGERCE